MRLARWVVRRPEGSEKPVFYHLISRVVGGYFYFGPEEKEKFRTLMRLQEKFTGCKIVSYCLTSNHFHLLVEVPSGARAEMTDEDLLARLAELYSAEVVDTVAKELADARDAGDEPRAAAVHARYAYRMHDMGEFMKGLLQRFTQWFNSRHERVGRLWEDRYRSVIVEDGIAAKAIAAYIDLNPIRAGVVEDPADYPWSSYGEAMGANPKGDATLARAGLVRALRAHEGVEADAEQWPDEVEDEYRRILMVIPEEPEVDENGQPLPKRRGRPKGKPDQNQANTKTGEEVLFTGALRRRIRHFTEGTVVGTQEFVESAFEGARERFGPKRKSGARKPRGAAAPLAGTIWTMRDLNPNIKNKPRKPPEAQSSSGGGF